VDKVRPCECLAMLVADKVIREDRTHKVYILGTFNSIFSQNFPTVHDAMHVYLALTDAAPGQHTARLQIVYIDQGLDLEEEELLKTEGPLVFTDKLQVLEFNLEFRRVRLPKAGTLDVRFYLDDVFVASRRLRIVQQPPPPPKKDQEQAGEHS